jgi:hypothetical protein
MSSEVMLFSSKSTEGVIEARTLLDGWLRDLPEESGGPEPA